MFFCWVCFFARVVFTLSYVYVLILLGCFLEVTWIWLSFKSHEQIKRNCCEMFYAFYGSQYQPNFLAIINVFSFEFSKMCHSLYIYYYLFYSLIVWFLFQTKFQIFFYNLLLRRFSNISAILVFSPFMGYHLISIIMWPITTRVCSYPLAMNIIKCKRFHVVII